MEFFNCCERLFCTAAGCSPSCEFLFSYPYPAAVAQRCHLVFTSLLYSYSMACDIASTPFYETSAFEEDWQTAVHGGTDPDRLGLVAELNAASDNNAAVFDSNSMATNNIDPQLLDTAAASPDTTVNVFDQAFASQGEFVYEDHSQPTPVNTPYFDSNQASIAPAAPIFASSPLRHQLHRRSVSEPPDNFQHNFQLHQQEAGAHFVPAGPPMTLTRAGHFLGQPKPQRLGPRIMKSLPKSKHFRGQPYTTKNDVASQRMIGERYDFRQRRPQPMHAHTIGPTSVPQEAYINNPTPAPQPLQHPHTTSRVCTPAPSPMHEGVVGSPGPIHPMFRAMTPEKKVVSIPVEQLKSLIEDAVRKAVEGIETAKMLKAEGAVQDSAQAGAELVDEDDIVVASVESREGAFGRSEMGL